MKCFLVPVDELFRKLVTVAADKIKTLFLPQLHVYCCVDRDASAPELGKFVLAVPVSEMHRLNDSAGIFQLVSRLVDDLGHFVIHIEYVKIHGERDLPALYRSLHELCEIPWAVIKAQRIPRVILCHVIQHYRAVKYSPRYGAVYAVRVSCRPSVGPAHIGDRPD